ncbi:hypothetical protein PCC7424_1016 [Gloeothece citriformis PCC 7424]|uniref:Class I SAM-dependent methyltransferase n=1 Tax=Gloeothece citriformis (strain PCC 7424) TaxID=65393 RepID=B7KIR4_GLOC7|nr:class I SAM-dependent methyltransferase [Gloeothece citriformis]ACK69470.1 hypothetical protein PCC7424_1016 [Gloeothece citriformis PCC 7424]
MLKKIGKKIILKIPEIKRIVEERNQLRQEQKQLHQDLNQLHQEKVSILEKNEQAFHLLSLKEQNKLIETEYPYYPKCRNWLNKPSIKKLIKNLESNDLKYINILQKFAKYEKRFLEIPVYNQEDLPLTEPFWSNSWIPGLDSISLYGFVAERNPRYYLEVGSGNSTKFVRKAITNHNLKTQIISIDPHPRAEINSLCDQIIRQPLEDVDYSLFETLTSDDILFIDNSHRSFPNSDVTVFFLEILPNLPKGLLYGIHDIFLPYDYPEYWKDRYYNEQYLLAVYLLGGANGDEIVLPNGYLSDFKPNLKEPLQSVFSHPSLKGIEPWGGIFWMQRSPHQED